MLELLVVLALVALLAGIVLGAGRRAVVAGRSARARIELAGIGSALDAYRRAYGDFPRTEDPARLLQSLLGRRSPTNVAISGRSLLDLNRLSTLDALDPVANPAARLIDPWGEPYRYAYKIQAPWSDHGFVLYSSGNDRRDSPALLTGGFPDLESPLNTDNLYADQP